MLPRKVDTLDRKIFDRSNSFLAPASRGGLAIVAPESKRSTNRAHAVLALADEVIE